MKNEKDMKLVNIYIKIHNKKPLFMDDLAYLAKYNPECFKKTCDNLIYNIPEAKPLVNSPEPAKEPSNLPAVPAEPDGNLFHISEEERLLNEMIISRFLQNLQNMESQDVDTIQNVDVAKVKDLMGNLYMEELFPHNDRPGYFEMYGPEPPPSFNVRA